MKKAVLSIVIVAVSSILVSCNKAVPFQELPEPAKSFLSTHYAGKPVPFAKSEWCGYEVLLPDGTEIEFNSDGEWEKIEAEHATLPATIIATLPTPIGEYLATTFVGIPVEKIEKGFFGGYELELVNDAELEFRDEGTLKSCSF
ncbi:MAG: PepSY-like domain-containing protein [Prevotella sp.]|nr:PepSY-like domain-containing protein [Candidatus Equicola faecalis]